MRNRLIRLILVIGSLTFAATFSGQKVTSFPTNANAYINVGVSKNLGIGTSAPTSDLEVSGAIKISGANAAMTNAGQSAADSFTAASGLFDTSQATAKALCFNGAHQIKVCTSIVDASGNCTCP